MIQTHHEFSFTTETRQKPKSVRRQGTVELRRLDSDWLASSILSSHECNFTKTSTAKLLYFLQLQQSIVRFKQPRENGHVSAAVDEGWRIFPDFTARHRSKHERSKPRVPLRKWACTALHVHVTHRRHRGDAMLMWSPLELERDSSGHARARSGQHRDAPRAGSTVVGSSCPDSCRAPVDQDWPGSAVLRFRKVRCQDVGTKNTVSDSDRQSIDCYRVKSWIQWFTSFVHNRWNWDWPQNSSGLCERGSLWSLTSSEASWALYWVANKNAETSHSNDIVFATFRLVWRAWALAAWTPCGDFSGQANYNAFLSLLQRPKSERSWIICAKPKEKQTCETGQCLMEMALSVDERRWGSFGTSRREFWYQLRPFVRS